MAPAIGLPANFECRAGNGFPSKSVVGCTPSAKALDQHLRKKSSPYIHTYIHIYIIYVEETSHINSHIGPKMSVWEYVTVVNKITKNDLIPRIFEAPCNDLVHPCQSVFWNIQCTS